MLNRCLRCDAVFNRVGKEDLCPQCEDGARRYAQLVDDFLAFNHSRDPGTIAAATGVPRRFVVHYLVAQNPSAAAQAELVTHCVRCGVVKGDISPYCKRCLVTVRQAVHRHVQETVEEEVSPNDGPGMYGRPAESRRERTGGSVRRARRQ